MFTTNTNMRTNYSSLREQGSCAMRPQQHPPDPLSWEQGRAPTIVISFIIPFPLGEIRPGLFVIVCVNSPTQHPFFTGLARQSPLAYPYPTPTSSILRHASMMAGSFVVDGLS
ncbi:hypothetical protein C0Q70_13676 [Pomacea canaliculata]|uniref:Uncharacterized protein n=1 Tax=Pomacea canaliculata TaxID=400727 RepID=A0A2T7NXV4_POMCA|nr:hypothetical protein C0Q70_13676 [Pomacea canaliculata]